MSEQLDPKLLQRAVDDRSLHPWRYYRLEPDVMKRLLDELSDRVESAEIKSAAGAALAPLEFEDLRAARDACFSEAVRCEMCARNTSDAGALRAAVEWRKTATRLDAALTQMSQLRAARAGDPARESE